jgi:probable phosphomutase (TIGR03848 family)
VTAFLLIRHAHCDPVGKAIAGRASGVHLNSQGRAEAIGLARRLSSLAIAAVYSSPLERAVETATPVAELHGLEVQSAVGLTEIDFGAWTGKTLAELDQLAEWKAFNSFRSGTRIPGGENMTDVLARALAELERLGRRHAGSGELVAIVSHGDVLRVVVAHYLGISSDLLQRIELSPASITVLSLDRSGPRILQLNSTAEWPAELRQRQRRNPGDPLQDAT